MKRSAAAALPSPADSSIPQLSAVVELLKPVTWFAAMWAFLCGVISSGASLTGNVFFIALGMVLAGPLVCGMSQAINDWYDRDVDAINEPDRPIPSGRVPGRWGLWIALIWTALSLVVAAVLGAWVLVAAIVGLILAWAYSAPPLRLKRNGWFGNAAVGFSYEGLAWFTGAAAVLSTFPDGSIIALAVLYSIGAHGIMTLNDFKAIEGDRQMGVRTLPVQLGAAGAARVACLVMAVPQLIVVALLMAWGKPVFAAAVVVLIIAQLALMVRFLLNTDRLMAAPYRNAALYNATGVTLYVSGMMVSAFAVRSIMIAGG
ncbi:MAG: chlorophyll synthase ChlG [Pseudomonadota bacterium]